MNLPATLRVNRGDRSSGFTVLREIAFWRDVAEMICYNNCKY